MVVVGGGGLRPDTFGFCFFSLVCFFSVFLLVFLLCVSSLFFPPAWTASNQERIGFFLPQLLQLLHSVFANVRANAMIALANAIHFHESNRRRLMFEAPGSLELLVKLLNDDDVLVQAHTARCVGKEGTGGT